jgi:hypothetical protein
MTNSPLEILVAARGWSHSAWLEDFYPDDLPEDWQLAFYSNEFRAVVVPESIWKNLDIIDVERWVEDTHENFLFYLEVEDLLIDWSHASLFFNILGNQLGGILLRPVEVDADLSLIASCLSTVVELAPTSLLLPADVVPSKAGEALLKQYHVEQCWNIGDGRPSWLGSDYNSTLAVARITGDQSFTAREWRAIIEISLEYGRGSQATKDRRVLIMIESDAPSLNDLRTAMMITDMLVLPGVT